VNATVGAVPTIASTLNNESGHAAMDEGIHPGAAGHVGEKVRDCRRGRGVHQLDVDIPERGMHPHRRAECRRRQRKQNRSKETSRKKPHTAKSRNYMKDHQEISGESARKMDVMGMAELKPDPAGNPAGSGSSRIPLWMREAGRQRNSDRIAGNDKLNAAVLLSTFRGVV